MAQEQTTHHHDPTAAVEHMEEEIRALEGETGRPRWLVWVLGILILAAIAAGIVFLNRSRPPERAPATLAAAGGVPLEVREPRPGSRLSSAPTTFSWESVSGRHDYLFRIVPEGSAEPVIERSVRTPSVQLTPEEAGRLVAGLSYVWSVAARKRDGTVIGSGQARFRLD